MNEEEIFHQELARSPEERAAYLEQACAGDPALRAAVEALTRHWQLRLERACYESERAGRQFQACEPENRLVARELERR